MQDFELFKQGAEARLYKGVYLGRPSIAKERFVKSYRHVNLDTLLTKERMKAENRALVRCKMCGIRTPMIYLVDFTRRTIFMEYFEHSMTAKDFIESISQDPSKLNILLQFASELGAILARMHENNIIHGDLTSSNVLLVNKSNEDIFVNFADLEIVLIDFGLAHIDSSNEDKGVDLYVLERALLSTHSIADKLFPRILKVYQKSYKQGSKEVVAKYQDVRARGRKRTMVG